MEGKTIFVFVAVITGKIGSGFFETLFSPKTLLLLYSFYYCKKNCSVGDFALYLDM